MDAEGEVEGGAAGGHVLEFALGRVGEDLVLEDVALDGLDVLLRAGQVALPVDELAQPGEALGVAAVAGVEAAGRAGAAGAALLVAPVGGDAELGFGVHVAGADLDLQRARGGPVDGGVQRLVAAGLGVADVVVEFAGDGPPEAMDDAEHLVALVEPVDEDAHGEQVVDLAEALAEGGVLLDLLVDGVDVLDAPADVGVDAVVLQGGFELALELRRDSARGWRGGRRPARRCGGSCRAAGSGRRGLRAAT